MAEKKKIISLDGQAYPLMVSIPMIVAAIVLSFVDLAFLNDVIGQILSIGSTESLLISFGLGLIGIAVMAHQGIKEAHGGEKALSAAGHYALWIFIGLAYVLIRIFSATIMKLENAPGEESVFELLGTTFRQVDLVTAPIMFLMYLATGFLIKDGVKNLLLNPEFEEWKEIRKKTKATNKDEEDKRRKKAEERIAKAQDEAEKRMRTRQEQIDKDRETNARNGNYSNALAQFRAKEQEIKSKYQKISSNLDYVRNIDKQEDEFEAKVKPSLMKIVQASLLSTQNNVALAMRKKTDEDPTSLRNTIELHNNSRHE